MQDRELQLHDGKRLLRHDRYDFLKSELGLTDEQLASSGVLRIHPSFRIVALSDKSKGNYIFYLVRPGKRFRANRISGTCIVCLHGEPWCLCLLFFYFIIRLQLTVFVRNFFVSAGGDSSKSSWITSEMLSLFLFHEMRPLSSAEELKIIEELVSRDYDYICRIID